MLGAIFIGMGGMQAYSKGLQTISNNVANLNTPGFKASNVGFADVFNYGGLGSAYAGRGSDQTGAGVKFNVTGLDFSGGDLRQTGGDLDLAIRGAGFLVMIDGDQTYYGRTGQFAVDDDGYIAEMGTQRRLAVLDSSGRPVALSIQSKRISPPQATTRISFSENLSTGATEATVSDIPVYDSTGKKHVWTVKFTPVGTTSPGEWNVVVSDQGGDEIATGRLRFIAGVVDPSTSTMTVNTTPTGADPLAVTLDFGAGVASYSTGTSSTIRATPVDGRASGTLTAVTVEDDGQIQLTYSNGQEEALGSVAIADFRNPQTLEQVGNGMFVNRGGQPRYVASGAEGVGSLVAGSIEASNVDLAEQFGNLILVQRGFQASSQVVSVSNDMIQQLFGMRGQG